MPLILDINQAKTLSRKKRSKKLAPVRSPSQAERILRIKTEQLWEKVIFPSLERIKWAIGAGYSINQLTILVDQELQNAVWMYGVEAETIVGMWQLAVNNITRAKINAALTRSLGIDITPILDDPKTKEALLIGSWEAESLIKTMPTKLMGDVAQAVMENFRGVPLPEGRSLLEQIDFLGTRSKKWAKFIARDQTAKLTGTLNQTRQEGLGIDSYYWKTMQDGRVVGNPTGKYPEWISDKHKNHYKMEGLLCQWQDSMVYSTDDGKTWRKRTSDMPRNHPSQDIGCRCQTHGKIDLDRIIEEAFLQ
jgi:uncharacterized protein with gpF-like domain